VPDPTRLTHIGIQKQLEQRVEEVQSELMHKQKERLELMGERLQLLALEPTDASHFHKTVMDLLSEKISILETIKMAPYTG